jgi:ribosome-binding factor A
MPSIRKARVAEMIKRELAEILQREMNDPRLALVSVNEVEVAPDLSVARVFVSAIGDEEKKKEAFKALQGASGFLRGQLGHRIELRTVPALQFRHDTGVERGARMFELLREEEREIGAGGAGEDATAASGDAPAASEDAA